MTMPSAANFIFVLGVMSHKLFEVPPAVLAGVGNIFFCVNVNAQGLCAGMCMS